MNVHGGMRECKVCGSIVVMRPRQLYCSQECAAKWHNKSYRGIKHKKTCKMCGKTFDAVLNSGRVYCGDPCSYGTKPAESKQKSIVIHEGALLVNDIRKVMFGRCKCGGVYVVTKNSDGRCPLCRGFVNSYTFAERLKGRKL